MNASFAGERAPKAQPFVRTVMTPAAAPWDQSRAAQLEARHTAPINDPDLRIVVKRLETWRPGAAGRFAAVYIHAEDLAGGFKTSVRVSGRDIPIEVASKRETRNVSRQRAALLAAGAVAAAGLVLQISITLGRRAEDAAQLDAAQARLDLLARQAKAVIQAKGDAQVLESYGLEQHTLSAALSALTYVANSRAADARIDAFYWQNGYWAVEARGESSPFEGGDNAIARSREPVRPGVWLWAPKDDARSPAAEAR